MVDQRRTVVLNNHTTGLGPVVYVMAREQRVEDNWALLYALQTANARRVPLLVLFALAPMFNHGSARHNEWMVASLKEVAETLAKYEISFFVECGTWAAVVADFAKRHQAGEVVFDFNPLEPVRAWREQAAQLLTVRATVVDARNIVPCFVASPKAEFAAYTFRPKIQRLVPEFLTKFPKVTKPDVLYSRYPPVIDWDMVRAFRQCDYSEVIPTRLIPGSAAGKKVLDDFLRHRLADYNTKRNDPTEAGVSDLSPYLRWGNLSAARVALAVQAAEAPRTDKDAFLEELIVRRELSDNFCYYTKDHTKVKSAHPWAVATLAAHAGDVRDYTYSFEEFRDGKTHDDLWNAAQRQMVEEGKMHGFLRMYWAKKILEWTPDAQTAVDIALRLNDHYELDGRDSNGVVGVMWSIGGVHDRAWTERPIFGKIRYMNYAGCKRKFNVKAFVARYTENQPSVGLFS
jgi:deoxyribodipyrimidine photo-lyase